MLRPLLFLSFAALLLFSCTTKEEKSTKNDSFDRAAMLENWADNIIIPSLESFRIQTEELHQKTLGFLEAPSPTTLAELRLSFRESYGSYQQVALFRTGMAETINYHRFLNTYPADLTGIKTSIEEHQYNFELPSSADQQGFPALDYLLYGLAETDQDLITFYTSADQAESYKEYLQGITERIHQLTTVVLADWKNTFRDDFVSNTSSSSTGAVDRFTNDFIMYFETHLRSGKIGIPAGAFTGDPVPENVEGRFARDLSLELYLKALGAVKDFFNGKHVGMDQSGPSYRQYLDYLNSIKKSEDLSNLINSGFQAARQQAASLDPDFGKQLADDDTALLQVFDELQKLVVLLKVDMMQAFSISVDYVDSDGD